MPSKVAHREFDDDVFRSSKSSELVDYMESILADPMILVSPARLDRMIAELDSYDEYHLVYSIELGMRRLPALFAVPIARLLSHTCQSVRLATHRNLAQLPTSMVSDTLIDACASAIQSGKQFADVGDIVELLRRKQETGTSGTAQGVSA